MKEIETKVKISADSKKARQEIKELERGSRDLETRITGLTREQLKLVDALGKTDRGTKAYKELAKQLRDVEREAQGVSRALAQVERIQQRQEQRGARRQGFVAGIAQGTGLGQYIPTGREMAPRMAGMAVGGMARRAYGMGAAPFMTPGIGGISAGLGGIPIAGGFLSGALQTAAGAYQSAVGFDRARLQALPYSARALTAREMAQRQRVGGAMADQVLRSGAEKAAGVTIPGQSLAMARSVSSEGAATTGMAAGALQLGRWAGAMQGVPRSITDLTYELLGQKIGGGVGRATKAVMETQRSQDRRSDALATRNRIEETAKAKAARIRTRAASGDSGLGPIEMGGEFGISPTEAQGMIGEFFGARGGGFERKGFGGALQTGEFREAMAAKTLYGVGMGQSGAFARMGVAGGGGQIGPQGLSGVLQAAVAQGMHGSQVTEYLSTLVSLGQQAERTGVTLDVREFTRQTAQLTAAGMQGLQAQRVAGGMQRAGMGLTERGISSPMDMLMLRAGGYDPNKGVESYAEATEAWEGGGTAKMWANVMQQITEGVQGGGGGPASQRLWFKRALGSKQIPISMKQAGGLMSAYQSGGVPALEKYISAQEGMGGRAGMIGDAKAGVGRVAPTARGAAALEAQRIGVGQEIAPAIRGMEANSVAAAKVMANFTGGLEKINGAVSSLLKWMDKFTGSGLAGVADKVVRGVLGAQGVNLPAGG